MSWEELESVLNALGETYRKEAEQTRLIMYSVFQSQSTKKLKPSDVMEFSWEKETPEAHEALSTENLIKKEDALSIITKLKK